MNNLEEMDRFLEKFNLSRLNQEETQIMNNPLQALKLKLWSKISQKTKAKDQMASKENYIKHLEKSKCLSFWNPFKKLQRKEHFHSFYEATITLLSKPDKDKTHKENYRPVSLMNIDANILNKTLANRIQPHNKELMRYDQIWFIPGL